MDCGEPRARCACGDAPHQSPGAGVRDCDGNSCARCHALSDGKSDGDRSAPSQVRSSAACDSWVRLLFANAAEAEISLLLNTGIKRETYRLTADGASAEAALGAAYNADTSFQGDRYWSGEKIVEQHPLADDRLVDDGIVGEYEEFIRLALTGAPSTCSLTDAAFSMQLAEAVQNGYSGPLPPLRSNRSA